MRNIDYEKNIPNCTNVQLTPYYLFIYFEKQIVNEFEFSDPNPITSSLSSATDRGERRGPPRERQIEGGRGCPAINRREQVE